MRKLAVVYAFCAAWIAVGVSNATAQGKPLAQYGIVLMHGKGGQPGGYIDSLAEALKNEGAHVVMPRMSWSGAKGRADRYELTYQQSLAQIDRAIERLKAEGAKKIVVGGQSLGANAAMGYAARHKTGLAAVIALAPGHTPERMKKPELVESVATARQLVASGQKDASRTFLDINQGRTFEVQGKAAAYLSFFDPNGPAIIPRNAAAMSAVPFLWVIGRSDPLSQLGRGYAYDKAAKHPKSKYVEVDADHLRTPDAARSEVVAWLKSL